MDITMTNKIILILTSFFLIGCTNPMDMVQPLDVKKTVKVQPKKKYKPKKVSKVTKRKPVRYNIPKNKPQEYWVVMKNVALDTKQDKKYKKMSIPKSQKKWFRELTYLLWDRQITKHKFLKEGLKKYPGHRYELNFIINGMRKHHK